MPIYEYLCADCGANFEKLVAYDARVVCEKCGSKKVEKQISSFATNSISANAPSCAESCGSFNPASAGGCCGGHCHGHL